MIKKSIKGFIIISSIILGLCINNNEVKADELSQIESLTEATEYANVLAAIEGIDSQVLGTVNMTETSDGLVVISAITGEELVYGNKLTITKSEYDDLCKIVQAEAGNQGEEGKMLVASVILNRLNSTDFANDIHSVIFQKSQFSPVSNGSFKKAVPNEETISAVNRVLDGEDISQGALYFRATSSNGNWGNHKFLFAHGGHKFYS